MFKRLFGFKRYYLVSYFYAYEEDEKERVGFSHTFWDFKKHPNSSDIKMKWAKEIPELQKKRGISIKNVEIVGMFELAKPYKVN